MLYLLFRKGDFCLVRCLWDDFKGGILGSTHHFRGDPYLKCLIFSTVEKIQNATSMKHSNRAVM